MARPAKTLLQRCQERSFRARHHAHLLASAPDLPCLELTELQRRARVADMRDELAAIAREFQRTLAGLAPEQLPSACPKQAPRVADAPGEPGSLAPPGAGERKQAFLAAVQAALTQLPARFRTQLTTPEQIQAELIRHAAQRLAAIDDRLAADGLTVPGSHSQPRPHPLLSFEAGLRRELTHSLRQLEFTVRSRATVERLNALTREPARPRRTGDRGAQRRPATPGAVPTEQPPGQKAARPH